jgi:hypothetical protein
MRIPFVSLAIACLGTCAVLSAQGTPNNQRAGGVLYESPYGFCFSLPHDWTGFSIVNKEWQGYSLHDESGEMPKGPMVLIRSPKWTEADPHEDIPIMVFTIKQWRELGNSFTVSAAPFPPGELGRNKKYVFALPARYNYDFLDGYEEVGKILMGKPLHAPCGKN